MVNNELTLWVWCGRLRKGPQTLFSSNQPFLFSTDNSRINKIAPVMPHK